MLVLPLLPSFHWCNVLTDWNHIKPFLRPQGKDTLTFSLPVRRNLHSLSYPVSPSFHVTFHMPSPRSFTSFPTHEDLFYFCTTSSTSEEDLNIHYAPPSRSSLRIGVIILGQEQVQLCDLAALDLFAMIGRNRIGRVVTTANAIDEAVDEIDIRYVSLTGEGSYPVTSGTRMPVTVS
jgi:hypothetical protein